MPTPLRHASLSLLGLVAAAAPGVGVASSHGEAPLIALDPAADNADLYAWVTPGTHDKLYVVATFLPFEVPGSGQTFAPDVRYEIHLAETSRAGLPDRITYFVEFHTPPPTAGTQPFGALAGAPQTYQVVRLRDGRREVLVADAPVAPAAMGPRTDAAAWQIAAYDDAFADTFIRPLGPSGEDGRVWAGPRDDAYYADHAGLRDLLGLSFAPDAAPDGLAGFNCHAIALELPIGTVTPDGTPPTEADGQLGVWAAASRRKMRILRPDGTAEQYGPWVQVSRVGLPLVNELLIGLQDKDAWNTRPPGDDMALFGGSLLNPVLVRTAETQGLYAALDMTPEGVDALRQDRQDLLAALSLMPIDQVAANPERIGDVLRVNLWQDSRFPNGRALPGGERPDQEQVDVTDAVLTLILTGGALPLGDFVEHNDVPLREGFPFLAGPHPGGAASRPTP